MMKSLKNTLMDVVIYNFKCLFDKDPSNIQLPPFLFEQILKRSYDIHWKINPKYLQNCLQIRDKLNWNMKNMAYNQISLDCFKINDMKYILNLKPNPVSINIINYSLKNSEEIGEILQFVEDCKVTCINDTGVVFGPGFTRLRRLSVCFENGAIKYNFKSIEETLEILEIEGGVLLDHNFDSIKSLKNLKHLSLSNVYINDERKNFTSFSKCLTSLKSLRCLNLKNIRINGDIMASLSNLPKLEILDLCECKGPNNIEELLKNKKFKYLGLSGYGKYKDFHYAAVEKLAEKIGGDFNLETKLALFEVYIEQQILLKCRTKYDINYDSINASDYLSYHLNEWNSIDIRRFEKICLHYLDNCTEPLKHFNHFIKSWCLFSQDFQLNLCSILANHVCMQSKKRSRGFSGTEKLVQYEHIPVLKIMIEYIKSSPNKYIAFNFMKVLRLYYENENKNAVLLKEYGLLTLCRELQNIAPSITIKHQALKILYHERKYGNLYK